MSDQLVCHKLVLCYCLIKIYLLGYVFNLLAIPAIVALPVQAKEIQICCTVVPIQV